MRFFTSIGLSLTVVIALAGCDRGKTPASVPVATSVPLKIETTVPKAAPAPTATKPQPMPIVDPKPMAPVAEPQQEAGLKGTKRPGPPGTVKSDEFNERAKVAAKRGGELVQAVNVGFRSLDADQDNSALTSEVVEGYILEALTNSDVESWETTPWLAERWDIEDILELKDGKTVRGKVTEGGDGYDAGYVVKDTKGETVQKIKKDDVKDARYGTAFTFYLRKGVKFHNGQDFTAKDVEWTLKLLKNPKNGMPSTQGYFEKVKECTVIDDYTIRMVYGEQYWMALSVCGGYMKIRPHKAWDPDGLLDKDPDAFFKTFNEHALMMNPIGTGPYQFDSFKKDFEVVIKRFEGWWGAKPLATPINGQWPDKIRFRIIKDVVAQLAALKNGEVDYVTSIPPEQFDAFFENAENLKNFGKVEMVYPMFGYFGFNLRKEIWKDKNVRWAIAHGCADHDKFLKDVLKGRAEMVCSPNYKYATFYNNDLKTPAYDPKKAADLLAEAGWWDSDGDGILDKDGKKLEFEILTREMPPTMPAIQHCLLVQSNLKKLGIKVEVRKLEWTAFLDKVEKGDFDVCRLGWALSSPPNTQDNFQIWHSSSIGEAGSNHIAYSNKEVDDILVKIRRELDEKKRTEMQKRFQQIIHDDQPYIFLWMPAELRAYSKKWRGVRFWLPRPCHSLNEWSLGE